MTLKKKILFMSAAATVLSSMTFVSAHAQDSEDTNAVKGIDTIIVSARKREESLQDVPLTISAFDQKTLEKTFIPTIDKIGDYIPNVQFGTTEFAGKSLTATIRGVGFADVDKSFEPAVGFAVDGLFLASSGGAAIDVFDIEQVEVLRGPQGTLYGRNTVGGVISVTRTAPTEEAGLRALTRIGNHGRTEFLAVANSGRMGDFAFKGYAFKKDGKTYATNLATGKKDDATDNLSLGGAMSYDAGGNFNALVSVDVYDDNSGIGPTYNLSLPGAPLCSLSFLPFFTPASQGGSCAQASIDLAEASGFEVFNRGFPSTNKSDGYSITANLNWDINDNLTLTSVTGWRDSNEDLLIDNLSTPFLETTPVPFGGLQVAAFLSANSQKQDQFSQELRLSGALRDNIDFVAGAFFMDSSYETTSGEIPLPGGGTAIQRNLVFGGILGGAPNIFDSGQKLQAYALFGDGTWNITDRFSVSGGLRYTLEEKEFNTDFISSGVAGVSGTSITVDESFDAITGRAILQYDLSDDIMAFGGWSRGFRSGGFNGRASSVASVGPYDPETVDSFEGGLRMELLDNRLRVNPTVFVTRYKDKQEEISAAVGNGTQIETVVENAAAVDIWGLELDWQAQLNEYFSLRGSAGYLSAKYDEFIIFDLTDPLNPAAVDVSDTRQLRRAPKYSSSWGAAFNYPLRDNLNFVSTLDYTFTDEFFTNLTADTTSRNRDIVKAQDALNLTIGVESDNDTGMNWSLTGYARDLTDRDAGYVTTTLDVGAFYFGSGKATKLYGVELGVEF